MVSDVVCSIGLHIRASIEEEYAKRMTKLAKTTLGRDEIGYVLFLWCICLYIVHGIGTVMFEGQYIQNPVVYSVDAP